MITKIRTITVVWLIIGIILLLPVFAIIKTLLERLP